MSGRLQFVVFSFNRGRFLEHCVQTLERCAPQCPVLIFDDDSDDPQTRAVLQRLARRYTVVTPRPLAPGSHGKHGGLYANMQAALDGLDDDVLMCTLQDDMQLVRSLRDEEIETMAALLERDEGRRFLHHAFLKGAERHRSRVRFVAQDSVYYAGREQSSAGSHYSDIFIARVAALRAVNWRFLPREAANEQQARQVFLPMGHWRDPFAAWLPAATAWRGKKRTWALRRGEKRHRCGFHPLRVMDEEQRRCFLVRDPAERLPWAEDWLELEKDDLPQPWVYHPLQGSRWLKWLNSVELKLGNS
ncbi:MAG: glycosyltransferase family A protein [Pseudohongiellaceae bacterium]